MSADIEEMETELQDAVKKAGEEGNTDEKYTMLRLLKTVDLRMPLLVAVTLQIVQQLSGINAVSSISQPPPFLVKITKAV